MFMDLPLIFLPFYIAFIVTYLLSTWYFARKYFRLFDKFNEKFEKLLSGGQRQRLGIARALVRGAPIIIFDEATSSLDSISESKIQTAIENSFEDRTVFVIAHRLSTIRNVDHIIVLSEGTIIEQGDFDTLIQDNGHFAKLWKIQSKVQKGAEM
jgi:ATP-binding cassette subfamily B protein